MRFILATALLFCLSGCNATFMAVEEGWPCIKSGWEKGAEIDEQEIREFFGLDDEEEG